MIKLGLVAGCSHSAGAEINGDEDSEYNRDQSFGSLLCKKLGYEPVNIALGGATNSGIARSILRWVSENYNPNEMELFVCIGWTESSRLEVPALNRPSNFLLNNPNVQWYDTSANNYYRINFSWKGDTDYQKSIIPKYHEFMADNPIMLETWSLNDILLVQSYLKSLNIKYVMCSTMFLYEEVTHYIEPLLQLIDTKHYYQLTANHNQSFYWKYKNLGYINSNARYYHHSEEPHRLYAEELYKFIGEQQ
jgi:hypothetical protein